MGSPNIIASKTIINKKRIIEPNQKKDGVNSSFYFIWAMPKKSGDVHVNGAKLFFEKNGSSPK